MKLAIIGSRTFTDIELAWSTYKNLPFLDQVTHIVSGGAKGADSIAELLAKWSGKEMIVYYPDWDKYGKQAGFIRNRLIINDSDCVLAFWDLKSKGTLNSIQLATKKGIPVHIKRF
ncbi:MAG: SLOG family protein [Streptobacillus sp.]